MKPALLCLTALALAGCAKFPESGTPGANTQIKFTMTVAGKIKANYVYVVAIRWAMDPQPFDKDNGPIPVIASPWGNGIVAGRANVYVKWDASQSPEYQIFEFTDPIPDNAPPGAGPYLTNAQLKGFPLNPNDIEDGERTLEFTLDLSQIAREPSEMPSLRALQINFLTMDRVPQDPDGGNKFWDGLGDNGSVFDVNNFITISLDQNGIYRNGQGQFEDFERSNDTPDPDLDIVDWSVQVTRP